MRSRLKHFVNTVTMSAFAASSTVTLAGEIPPACESTVQFAISTPTPIVSPGATLQWSLSVTLSCSACLGLAGFATDLVPAGGPAPLHLQPAIAPQAAGAFVAPVGISQPPFVALAGGYGGTINPSSPVGTSLIDLGGVQNTLGSPWGNIGLTVVPQSGLALNSTLIVAQGNLTAPMSEGTYCIDVVDPRATVLLSAGGSGLVALVDNVSCVSVPISFCFAVQTLNCDSIDFNNDTSLFDQQDIDAFLSVYSEGPCIPSTATCNDIDFNNDGSFQDPCDVDSFLLVFQEGPCTLCGN